MKTLFSLVLLAAVAVAAEAQQCRIVNGQMICQPTAAPAGAFRGLFRGRRMMQYDARSEVVVSQSGQYRNPFRRRPAAVERFLAPPRTRNPFLR
jgi:hypothetical protein